MGTSNTLHKISFQKNLNSKFFLIKFISDFLKYKSNFQDSLVGEIIILGGIF